MSLKSGSRIANHKLVLSFHHPATNTCDITRVTLQHLWSSFPLRWKTWWRCILVVCPVGLPYTPVLGVYHHPSSMCGGTMEIPILVSKLFAFFARIFFFKGCHGE
jgi:hypothetical protein